MNSSAAPLVADLQDASVVYERGGVDGSTTQLDPLSRLPIPPPVDADAPALIAALNETGLPQSQSRFKMSEAAALVGVKPFVLRYWEQHFEDIQPDKTPAGHRRYRREDVALFLTIRRLRHDENFSMERVRDLLAGRLRPPGVVSAALDEGQLRQTLAGIHGELEALRNAARG